MMETIVDKRRTSLLRKFHTLCGFAGMTPEEKLAVVSGYGVQSSADMSVGELIDACNRLERQTCDFERQNKLDKQRKRLIAAIGAWLRATNRMENIHLIKSVACRAASVDNFNKIPADRLRSLYNAFNKCKKDLLTVDGMTVEFLINATKN